MSSDNPAISQQDPEVVTRTNPPPLTAEGLAPGANEEHPREGTSTAAQQHPPVLSPQGPRLRSGTILSGPNRIVSLDKFLNKLYERARDSDRLTITHCDALDHKLQSTREDRLARLQKLKENTEKFRKELEKFTESTRSLEVENNKSVNISDSGDSDSESVIADPTPEDLLLDWLEESLTETSPEGSPISPPNFNYSANRLRTMVDYAKVAKLTAQLVPLFSGEATPQLGRELQTFIGCCKQTLQCLNEEEKPAFLQILPTRLRGDAYQLFVSDVPTSFNEVEERLNRTYLPRETYQELVNKLITTRQNPLESLTAFTTRLKQLLTICNEAATQKYGAAAAPAVKTQLADFAKNALKSGVINPHLCQYLLTQGEGDIDALIQRALDMEKLQQSAIFVQSPLAQHPPVAPVDPNLRVRAFYRTPYNPGPTSTMYTSPRAPNPNRFQPPTHNTAPQPRPSFTRTDSRRQDLDNLIQNITCNFCQKRGHTYTDCLKRKNTPFCANCRNYGHDVRDCRNNRPAPPIGPPRPPNRPPTDSNHPRGPRVFNIRLKCKFCGRRGHSDEDCRQKKKWEARSQGNDVQSTQNSPARL